MNILVTGGAGFIGSNFIKYMLGKYEKIEITNYDLLTYAGNLQNLEDISGDSRYSFIKGDIRDRASVAELFARHDFDCVVNFAAESHVDRSIEEPEVFLTTNIIGAQVLLDAAKESWRCGESGSFQYKSGKKFIQISTDEVYGSLGKDGYFTEETNISPNSPYSASKASADMIVRAYYKTYSLPINITRCSNNYGPYQFPEKLIPLMINNALKDESIPVYGDGKQVRDWLYVYDHCSAIDMVIERGAVGEVYNIGGSNEKQNMEIVKLVLDHMGKSEKLVKHVKDRLGHDRRYAIDSSKIRELGWAPAYSFEKGMEKTISWYLDNRNWMKEIINGEYLEYYDRIYSNKI